VAFLTVILREVDEEEDKKTDSGYFYKQLLVNAKLHNGERGQKTKLT